MSRSPEILLEGLTFPEGPRWHEGRFWFSDFYTHRVLALGGDGKTEVVAEVPGQPSGLGWLPDGRLLVVSMLDRKLLRLDTTGLVAAADLSKIATWHCNDMVVDAEGRAYVGHFGFDLLGGGEFRTSHLILARSDGSVEVAADDMHFPNGAVVTPDGSTLIVAESFAKRLTAWDRDPDGRLENRRVFADLGEYGPDGICLDAEGAVWVAAPRQHEAIRVFEGGRIAERISLGDRLAIAPMLGGEDRRTLYLCTNAVLAPDEAVKQRAGRIEALQVEVPGAGLP